MRRVAEKVVAEYPVRALAAVHRVGELRVGDLAVVVGVSCPHRAEAFEACRKLIDDLKHEVPIWKHQGSRTAPRNGSARCAVVRRSCRRREGGSARRAVVRGAVRATARRGRRA